MDTLDLRLGALLREKRIALHQFLVDYDRRGRISEAQLLKGLRMALDKEWGTLAMSALELRALASAYADPHDPTLVRWRDLCAALERAPPPPRASPASPSAQGAASPSPRRAGTGRGGVVLIPRADAAARFATADAPDEPGTYEWQLETADALERTRAASRAADFGARVGRLAGVSAGETALETAAEVERELRREIRTLDHTIATAEAALAAGDATVAAARAFAPELPRADAVLVARRESAVARLRALVAGRPARERVSDGFVQANLAQVDALNGARAELSSAEAATRAAEACVREAEPGLRETIAHASHARAIERQTLAVGGRADPRLAPLGEAPPPAERSLHVLIGEMERARAHVDACVRSARGALGRALGAGVLMEDAAEAALEAKADSTGALAAQLRNSIAAHAREVEAARASVAEMERNRAELAETIAIAERRRQIHSLRERTPGTDAISAALATELRRLALARAELGAACERECAREVELSRFADELRADLVAKEAALKTEIEVLNASPRRAAATAHRAHDGDDDEPRWRPPPSAGPSTAAALGAEPASPAGVASTLSQIWQGSQQPVARADAARAQASARDEETRTARGGRAAASATAGRASDDGGGGRGGGEGGHENGGDGGGEYYLEDLDNGGGAHEHAHSQPPPPPPGAARGAPQPPASPLRAQRLSFDQPEAVVATATTAAAATPRGRASETAAERGAAGWSARKASTSPQDAPSPPAPRSPAGSAAAVGVGATPQPPPHLASLVERLARHVRSVGVDLRDELRAADRGQRGELPPNQFDSAMALAFHSLRLSHDEVAALRAPYETPSGLVKYRALADAVMGRAVRG